MKHSLKLKNITFKGIRIFSMILFLGSVNSLVGQVSSAFLGNFPNTPGFDYLGWDNPPLFAEDLDIEHRTPNQPILFRTNGQERMRMLIDGTIGVNTTNNDGARFNVFQGNGSTAVEAIELKSED